MTNYEWIKSLPVDKLVQVLYNTGSVCADCPVFEYCKKYYDLDTCEGRIKRWLEREVNND